MWNRFCSRCLPRSRLIGIPICTPSLMNCRIYWLAGKLPHPPIKTKQLREQMTGKVERSKPDASPSNPQPAPQKKTFPILIIAAVGVFVILFAFGGYWLISSNSGMFSAAATPTQQVLPSPTVIPPTQTIEPTITPTIAPTEASLPTETPVPVEIKDNKNVPMRLIPAGEFTMGSDDTGDVEFTPCPCG